MSEMESRPFSMQTENTPVAHAIEAHWTALLRDQDVPRRADIDPRVLRHVLTDCFILDNSIRHAPVFRIAGANIATLRTNGMRGSDFCQLFASQDQRRVRQILALVARCPAKATLRVKRVDGKAPAQNAKMLLLPLRGEDGKRSRVLGCLDVDKPMRTTRDHTAELQLIGFSLKPVIALARGAGLRLVVNNANPVSNAHHNAMPPILHVVGRSLASG